MSPHLVFILTAAGLAFAGKLLFPQSSIRVALVAAAALPTGMMLYIQDISFLGFVLITPISSAGGIAGVVAAKIAVKGIGAVRR